MPAAEILLATPSVKKLLYEGKTLEIVDLMKEGEHVGMQTFNQALATAYFQKQISLEVALSRSSNQDELNEMISRGAGLLNRNQTAAMAKGAAPGKR